MPAIIGKHELLRDGTESVQEAQVKFIYREPSGLGFASVPVVSLTFRRVTPVEVVEEIDPLSDISGALWCLVEIRFLRSPSDKSRIDKFSW